MNIKLINLVKILESKICISPIDYPTSSEICTSIECKHCPANIKDKQPNNIKVRTVRGIINEQGVE